LKNSILKPRQDIFSILLENGHINEQQAEQAKRRMRRANISAQQALVDLKYTSQDNIYDALSISTGTPIVNLHKKEIPEEVIKKVPAKVALHYKFVPLSFKRGTLDVAFANPPAIRDRENLRLLLGARLAIQLATPFDIDTTLKRIYGLGADTVLKIQNERISQNFQAATDSVIYGKTEGENLVNEDDEDASITRLVNQILLDAVRMKTTDIHIEPFHDTIRLRYRIDGMLRQIPTPPGMKILHSAIVSRLKIMANLNIAERRLPHDGRLRITIGKEGFDLRVSIMPTRFGETICLRILSRSAIFLKMSQLGLNKHHLGLLHKLIDLPHGIMLVTGPTGSGKTTTLYAALAQVRNNSPERKIITVEDPVEYELEGTTQMQMKSEIGLTFASGLRSILRHDPDIILIGEIRDGETAEIAIRSALTGHLVFSTLHTNDSVSAVNRLIDMGIEAYLVASSLISCLAQRLVRRICPHCLHTVKFIPPRIRSEIAKYLDIALEDVHAYEGRGCTECNHTGYNGRVAIYEFFLLNEEIQDMVATHAATSELRKTASEHGMITLRENGWEKLADKLTTIEEITRITGNFKISYDMGDED